MFVCEEPPDDGDCGDVGFARAVAGSDGCAFGEFEDAEDFGLLVPEFGVEVESSEFDGFAEALAGWDAVRRSFEGLRMAGRGRKRSIRHVVPFGVGACALAR